MAKKILVIDDNALVTKSLARLLEKENYSVGTAESCQEALNKIEEIDFDLIISDIRMPDIDGVETVHKIRANLAEKGKKGIPIIFITGYADGPGHENAKKLNPADFIYKPFEKDVFLASISKTLKAF